MEYFQHENAISMNNNETKQGIYIDSDFRSITYTN